MITYDDYCDAANPHPVSCSECKEDIENCECGEDPPEAPEDDGLCHCTTPLNNGTDECARCGGDA